MEEEAPRTVLYVGLLDISIRQTLIEGLPKTLVSLSLQSRAQAGGAVVWVQLVPTLGEGWFTVWPVGPSGKHLVAGVEFQSQL